MTAPHETVELTELRWDDAVDASVFRPPARSITDWRRGTAYIHQYEKTGRCSASWQPASGPGSVYVPGPEDVTFDEAMEWARLRTDDVRVSVERSLGPPTTRREEC
jgi:hypothetical protein